MTTLTTTSSPLRRRLSFLYTIIGGLLFLQTPFVWTWTTNRDVISSRVTRQQQQQQQRISTIDGFIARKDRRSKILLNENQNDYNEGPRWNRLRLFRRRRRDDSTQLFASHDDNSDDVVVNDDNEENQNIPNTEIKQVDDDDNEEVDEFVQKAQQAWTSSPPSSSIPPPKITLNKLNKTGARESLLNSYKGVSKGTKAPPYIGAKGTLLGNKGSLLKGSSSSIGSKGILPPIGIPPSSSPFTTGIPNNGMPKKNIMGSKSYGGKWGSKSKGIVVGTGTKSGGMKSFSDDIASGGAAPSATSVDKSSVDKSSIKGGISSPPPIMKGTISKETIQPPPPPRPPMKTVAKSPSDFLKEFAKSNAPKFMPKSKGDTTAINSSSSSSSGGGNANNERKDSNTNEEAKYLTVAKEAWSKFFSSQISQEDYVSMALDAWRDASSVKLRQENDGLTQLDVSKGAKAESDGAATTAEKKEGADFFSGLKNSLFPGANKSTSSSKSPVEKVGGNDSIKKGTPLGEKKKQITLPPLPVLKKGVASPIIMKSLGEKTKQITPSSPLPLIKKGIAPPTKSLGTKQIMSPPSLSKGGEKLGIQGKFVPKKVDTTLKKNWQGNRGGLSFLKSDKLSKEYKADKNYNPMNKAITVEKIKGVMKGKEASISGGKKQTSTPPPSLDKGGVKLGIQGKFAPKKLDPTMKTNWQGDRGGLSFLKSDKLSKEYKAEKNYNPMNKAITVEKINRFKMSLTGNANSDDDTEASTVNDTEESEDDEGELDGATLEPAPELSPAPPEEAATEKAEASKIERWNKESFIPTLKGSESTSAADTDADEESDSSKGKTTTISITDQGGTDVVNPGRAFIPAPRAADKKTGIGGGVKFASTKLGLKGGFSSPANGSSKILASKSGLLKGSIGAKKFGSPSIGGFLNKNSSKKIDFSLLKKGGISKGSKLPFQKDAGVSPENKSAPSMGLKGKGFFSKSINGLGANDKSSIPGPTDNAKSPLPFKSPLQKSVKSNAADTKKATDATTDVISVSKAKPNTPQSSATKLIADGMTAEEAENIRMNRLQKDENTPSTSSKRTTAILRDTPVGIKEGMTAEEAEQSRISRLDASDSMKQNQEEEVVDAGMNKGLGLPHFDKNSAAEDIPPPTMKKSFTSAPLKMKGPMSKASGDNEASNDSSVPKGLPLKGGMSMGEKQAGLPGKGMPFMKKAPSFSMEKKSLGLPPLPLKGKGDDGGLKKGMGMPLLAKKSFGDADTAAPMMKKAFTSAPFKMKGPMSKASGDDEASNDSSVPKGLPLKGGMSMGEKQAGLPGKGMPFMKKAPSFSMEKKSLGLPPLPLKGKGEDSGLKKGMGMPPLAKKSFGDADTAAPMMKKAFTSAPLKMKGPMSKASGDDEASNDSSVPKGLPLKGGMSMGEKQAGLPGKGMPFMKKAPSFSMEKKSLDLPPLPLKGKGDDGGLKKGMGMPLLAKKSFGDADTAAPMMKKAFTSAPLKMKGPMSKASGDDEASNDSSVPKGLPLKGGMSMGEKQAGLPGKGMPFMKKAPSFSMEKKSLGLPPLPLKGKGDDGGLKKGMGIPPLAKKSFGDADTAAPMMKKAFTSAPLKMNGPMSKASGDDEASNDSSVPKGLPLKGGMSMGEKQAGLPGKGMPFMKKAPSFSMEKKSLGLPPLPLKGKGDDGGLKKGMGIPPLAKKSFGDADTAAPMMKKAFTSAPLKMNGPMSKASGDDEASNDSSVPKGLPLKGGMSMGEKQAGLPGKGMPFMKKAPSFSMEKKSLGLPPLPLKGKGDDGGLKKGMGMPLLAKKSFGDADTAAPMMKKAFTSAPLKMKGPMSKASGDDEASNDSSVPKGLPLKGGMSMGEKQAGLPGKGMLFMKKAPSFSMEKKSLGLPPLPLKGKGEDSGLKKGMGMPPLAKKSFGDADTAAPMMKKAFTSAPLKMKGPMSKASGDDEASNDSSVPKGLPLKGGMSMGEKQAGLPGKGMPFMKKAPSFSMEKKSLGLPPLPLKGKGDDGGLKKGMGMPLLAKKSFGDADTAAPMTKKAFTSAPLKMKGPMSKASGDDEASNNSSVPKGLPLKGGMSMGEKQAGLPGKGMPFMKKAPSFSMEKKSLDLPPLPLKGKGDDGGLKKGMGMPPLAKKSFGDADTAAPMMKKAFTSAPLKMKGPMSKASGDDEASDDSSVPKELPLKGGISMGEKQAGLPGKGMPFMKKSSLPKQNDLGCNPVTKEVNSPPMASADVVRAQDVSNIPEEDYFTEEFSVSDESSSSWTSTPDKELGKGAAFLPKFSPPPMRAEPKDPNDFSWLESAEAIDTDPVSAKDESDSIDDAQNKETRRPTQPKDPVKLWGGESFLGTSSSRVYGLGAIQPSKSVGFKGNKGTRAKPSGDPVAKKYNSEKWASDDAANAARLMDEMNDSSDSIERRFTDEKKESVIAEEKRLIEEKTKIAALLYDTEKRLSIQLEKFQEETQILKDDRARAESERLEAEKRIQEIEAARIRAEKETERLEQHFTEEKAALSAKLTDAERARTDDEKRLVEEKTKVAALISDAEKKLALQLEKFEEERLQMNKEKETAAAERSDAQRKVADADAARTKAEKDAKALKVLLFEQKSKQEKWMEEQRILTEEALEKRIAEEKSKIDVALADAKAKEEARLAEAQKQLVDAQLEQRLAEMRILEIEASRIRAEKEAERLEQRFAKEKAALSAKLSDAERARTDDGRRLLEEKTKIAALISDAEKKLALQLEKFEEERLQMNKEKETAAAERSDARKKAAEADAARIKAEKDAKALEVLLSEQKSKQEKWMEKQRILTEEALEKRIAEEKSKIDVALAEAKAKEEARLAAQQKHQVQVQLEQRLAEEKSKLDAEIAAVEEKIRRELELLESGKMVKKEIVAEEEVKEEVAAGIEQEDETSTPETATPLEEELALPDEALDLAKDLPKLSSTTSDVLTADVEALELISMCQAEFDATYSTDVSSSDESCLLPTDYPFVSLLRDSSPYIVNHRHSTIVYHIPGDLISDVEKFNSVMDDIALTWLFGMKIVLCVGCRTQVSRRLDRLEGPPTIPNSKSGVRVTTDTALRVLEEEAGFCRFEVERQLNRCLRNKGANCNVVSGCFITAKNYGVVDGIDYQHTGYPKTLQTDRINRFISRSDVVLLTPLGFTEDGQALNIKSEQLAGFTAGALKASKVVYFSTEPMVMRGSNNSRDANANQRIQMIQRSNALQILSHHGLKIHGKTGFPHWNSPTAAAKNPKVQSMLLKMGWATDALDKGVERAHIIACDDGALLEELFTARRGYGTCISQDDYEAPHPEDQNDDLLADDVGAGVIGW